MLTSLLLAMAITAAPAPECANCAAPTKVYKHVRCKKGLKRVRCGKKIRCVPPAPPTAHEITVMNPLDLSADDPPPIKLAPVLPPPEIPDLGTMLPDHMLPPFTFPISAFVEVGPTLCGPEARLTAGLRLLVEDWHVGAEAYTMFQHGALGLGVLGYPLLLDHLRAHVGAGVLFQPTGHPAAGAVPRSWDFSVGAGLEIPVSAHVELIADWRWFRPFTTPAGFATRSLTNATLEGSAFLGGIQVRP